MVPTGQQPPHLLHKQPSPPHISFTLVAQFRHRLRLRHKLSCSRILHPKLPPPRNVSSKRHVWIFHLFRLVDKLFHDFELVELESGHLHVLLTQWLGELVSAPEKKILHSPLQVRLVPTSFLLLHAFCFAVYFLDFGGCGIFLRTMRFDDAVAFRTMEGLRGSLGSASSSSEVIFGLVCPIGFVLLRCVDDHLVIALRWIGTGKVEAELMD